MGIVLETSILAKFRAEILCVTSTHTYESDSTSRLKEFLNLRGKVFKGG